MKSKLFERVNLLPTSEKVPFYLHQLNIDNPIVKLTEDVDSGFSYKIGYVFRYWYVSFCTKIQLMSVKKDDPQMQIVASYIHLHIVLKQSNWKTSLFG